MKSGIIVSLLLCITIKSYAKHTNKQPGNPILLNGNCKKLKEGDLLFYVTSTGNPIADVTTGFENSAITHVAIFHRIHRKIYTLEAIHKGVVLQPVDSLLSLRANKKAHVLVGRVCQGLDKKASVAHALHYLGRPYDFYFEPGDSAIYCSELIQLCYKDKKGQEIFKTIPMSFHNSKGIITEYWKKYYNAAGKEVPEGVPGSNPGQLSRSKKINILYQLF